MPINITRGLLPSQANVPRANQLPILRPPRIAEVFEDLAAESTVELIVYENFLDLNPQVRTFPNLNPPQPIYTGEAGIGSSNGQENSAGDMMTTSGRRSNRRDIIRRYRLR